MKGIMQAVKRRMHKEEKQESKANGTSSQTASPSPSPADGSIDNTSQQASPGLSPSAAAAPQSKTQPEKDTTAAGDTSTSGSGRPSGSPTTLSSLATSSAYLTSPLSAAPGGSTPFVRSRLSGDASDAEGMLARATVGGATTSTVSSGGSPARTRDAVVRSPTRGIFGSGNTSGSGAQNSPPGAMATQATGDAKAKPSPSLTPSGSGSFSGAAGAAAVGSTAGIIFPPGITFDGNPFEPMPTLRETQAAKRFDLFRKKLHVSSIVFDFKVPNSYQMEKDFKRETLNEITEYVNNSRGCFNEQIMADVVAMVSANIFRALPPTGGNASPNLPVVYEQEEDEPALESAWPHLHIVYEFFLRFVVSHDTDAKIAKRYIEQSFVLKLLELFHSEDPRERDYLKTILHRIYGKIMAMRSFIRKAVQHVFFKSVHEREVQHGIAELLEILGSIVNGFALPLKEEHKCFLEKSLIPLHKARNLLSYHQYLAYCMTQYVEKDSRLAETIIMGLLKYWPATNTSKEVLFVNEVEEILELMQMPEFQRIMEPLFKRMALCIQSPHFQVAERVLFLWNNDHIVKMINQNRHQLFPIVIRALYKNSQEHWNTTVNGLTYNVSKLLAQADPPLFDECTAKNMTWEEKNEEVEQQRKRRWQELEVSYQAASCSSDSAPAV